MATRGNDSAHDNAGMTLHLHGVTPLSDWGVLLAEGDDARTFLHGQLTQDVLHLQPEAARLAAYCSPQGRVLASLLLLAHGPRDVFVLMSRDALPALLKRLRMFVLRAKVTLRDASVDFRLAGLAGDAMQTIAPHAGAVWSAARFTVKPEVPMNTAVVIELPPVDGARRGLWLAPADSPLPHGAVLMPELWAWSEVAAGVARIGSQMADAFVPQMLNYESVGAVNFKKGCYPGQEVVARSQFRGSIKRRAWLAHADVPLPVGAELICSPDPEQSAGQIVQSAAAPQGGYDAIAVIQTSALDAAPLHLGAADGSPVRLRPVPYPLLADV